MSIFDQDLTDDQIMMRDVCCRFLDNTIIPFISKNWKVDISHFKIVKALWPETAGVYAGPEE